MTKRLFVSIGIPKETVKKLIFIANSVVSEFPSTVKFRLTKEDNLHFTIIFLGSQEEKTIPSIESAIQEALDSIRDVSPKLFLREVDYADAKRFDMVWACADSEWMRKFTAILANKFSARNISFDKKPFKEHLTLIRLKKPFGTAAPDIRTVIGEEIGINGVSLNESILTADGPIYTTISSFKVERK